MRVLSSYFFSVVFLLLACNDSPEDTSTESIKTQIPQEKIWAEADREYILNELDRTTGALMKEIEGLGGDQWFFKEDPSRWSIAEIVEHLIVQNELHYREISTASHAPSMPQYLPITTGQDQHFQKYANDPAKSQAKWFLHPIGRFNSLHQSKNAFLLARDGLRDFVEATKVDLRMQFTFRNDGGHKPIEEVKIGDVRDLHQLLLTGIAHTDRHIAQIKQIKKHKYYPKDI